MNSPLKTNISKPITSSTTQALKSKSSQVNTSRNSLFANGDEMFDVFSLQIYISSVTPNIFTRKFINIDFSPLFVVNLFCVEFCVSLSTSVHNTINSCVHHRIITTSMHHRKHHPLSIAHLSIKRQLKQQQNTIRMTNLIVLQPPHIQYRHPQPGSVLTPSN